MGKQGGPEAAEQVEAAKARIEQFADMARQGAAWVPSREDAHALGTILSALSRKDVAIGKACQIIERADARLLALDGPCGGLPPDMTLAEWRELYVTLDAVRKQEGV